MKSADDFGEDTAQRILNRAVELDAVRQDRFSEDQLRRAALDLGIDPKDLAIAIDEARSSTGKWNGGSRWPQLLGTVGLGTALGAAAILFPRPYPFAGDWPWLGTLVGTSLAALLFIVRYRHRWQGWRVQGLLLGLWSGYTAGMVIAGRPWLDVFQLCAGAWVISAAIALALSWIDQWYDAGREVMPPSSPGNT